MVEVVEISFVPVWISSARQPPTLKEALLNGHFDHYVMNFSMGNGCMPFSLHTPELKGTYVSILTMTAPSRNTCFGRWAEPPVIRYGPKPN